MRARHWGLTYLVTMKLLEAVLSVFLPPARVSRLWCCCLSDCPGVEERSFNWSAGSACWRTTQKRRRTNEETRKFFIQSVFIVSQSPNDSDDDEVRNSIL